MADTSTSQDPESHAALALLGGSILLARIVSHVAQLCLFVFAARSLTPSEFGVFAIANGFWVILFVVAAAGWREIVLDHSESDASRNQAIAYSIFSGYAACITGVLSAGIAVFVFKSAYLSIMLLALAASLLVAPAAHALSALLLRSGAVTALAGATIVSEALGLTAGIAGLALGWNIAALGVAKLVLELALLCGVAHVARHPLRLIVKGRDSRRLIARSRSVVAGRLLPSITGVAPVFVVGGILGVSSAGYYGVAMRLISAASEILFEPLRLTLWVVFRHAAGRALSPSEVRDHLAIESQIVFPFMILVSAPVFISVAVLSEGLTLVVLGERWLPAAPVVSLLAVAAMLLLPSIATEPLLSINGKMRAAKRYALVVSCSTIILTFGLARFGLLGAAAGWLLASVVGFIGAISMQVGHAHAPWWKVARLSGPIFAGSIALVIAQVGSGYWLDGRGADLSIQLGVQVLSGLLAYVLVIFAVRPSFLRTTFWLG